MNRIRLVADHALGRLTMSALVIVSLGAIAVLALGLSIAGVLAIDPLAWLGSLVVAIAATTATSWIAARLVRVRAHLPSSIITGLILFLLFTPSLQPGGLAAIAVAGAVAGVSKVVIAPRGRHVVNPAAVGALVVGILQSVIPGAPLAYASWWVATPPLLPLVALGAVAVLWRTSTLAVGGAFVLLAAAIVTVRMVAGGLDVGAAIALALGSLPIVFFAGFMLSEPLTLPPRRWQRLVEVVVVAALFGIPFSIGPVFSSPELALVVGNVVAALFARRRAIRLRLEERREPAAGTWELAFRPDRPLRFVPGQWIELDVPLERWDRRGSRRVFSIVSAPGDELVRVAFAVPTGRVSALKTALLRAEPGVALTATGVGGDFVLPARPTAPVLLVAGGIGITPFVSQLRAGSGRGERRDAVLVLATSTEGLPAFTDELVDSGTPVVLFAPTAPAVLPAGWTYAGPGRPDAQRIAAAVPDLRRRAVFLSGPPAMVAELGSALRAAGARRIHRDTFAGS